MESKYVPDGGLDANGRASGSHCCAKLTNRLRTACGGLSGVKILASEPTTRFAQFNSAFMTCEFPDWVSGSGSDDCEWPLKEMNH
jgi:hypothetical protein